MHVSSAPGYVEAYRHGQWLVFWLEPVASKGGDGATGERWITLKPHGPDHPSYIHVKIRDNPDGSAHVISGPGELRGLRLSRLGEEGARRQQEARARLRERLANEPPEQRAERLQRREALRAQMQQLTADALQAAHALTEDANYAALLDPEVRDRVKAAAAAAAAAHTTDEHAAAQAAGRVTSHHMRAVQGAVNRLARNVIATLVQDDELKRAVLGEVEVIRPEELPGLPSGRGHRGYGYSATAEAEARGFSQEDARLEGERFWREQIERVAEQDPGRAARMRAARARLREMQQAAPAAREAAEATLAAPQTDVLPKALAERAEAVQRLIASQRALKRLSRELRRVELGYDPQASDEELEALTRASRDPRGSPWDVAISNIDPDLAAEIAQQIEDVAAEDLARSFLDAVSGEPATGWDGVAMRQAMHAPLHGGAYAHLTNITLATLGDDVLDRAVVDALGIEAAAKLAAHALRRDLEESQLLALRDSLARYHDDTSKARMQQAIEDAEAARAEALAIELPTVTSTTDAALVESLIAAKREHLREAHRALGTVLGQIEAGAALNFALMQRDSGRLLVNLGNLAPEDAATNLRALGLAEGDYSFRHDARRNLWAEISRQGMDALTPRRDAAERELAEHIAAIKRGEHDAPDWLPQGFVRYPASAFDANPPLPQHFAVPFSFHGAEDIAARLEEIVASRLAEGWSPAEIDRLLRRQDLIIQGVPPEHREAYQAAREALMPLTSGSTTKTARDGSRYEVPHYIDYGRLAEKHPELNQRLADLADAWLAKHRPGEPGYAHQHLEDTPDTRRALHMALVSDPRTQVAFKPETALTSADQRAIRSYYLSEIAKISADELSALNEATRRARAEFEARRPRPPKWLESDGGGLFGNLGASADEAITVRLPEHISYYEGDEEDLTGLTPTELLAKMGLTKPLEHYRENADGSFTLTEAGKEAITLPPAGLAVTGLEKLNPAYFEYHQALHEHLQHHVTPVRAPKWREFVERVGGTQQAYRAVREHMKSRFYERFARSYANLTGRPLRLSRRPHDFGEHVLAVADPELGKELERFRARERAGVQARGAGGAFVHMGGKGAVVEAVRKLREAKKAAESAQGMLFGVPAEDPRGELIEGLEGYTLPTGVERRIEGMMQHLGAVSPTSNPVTLIPDQTMGKNTRFAKQQRAIRAIIAGRKQGMFLGVGSGKTAVGIGAFTELHHQGRVHKGLFIVPSVVRDQFGEEMARMLEPGRYRWHAQEASREQRLAAYRDPDTHMVSVTHQAWRDDMVHLMAEHHGLSPEAMTERFLAADLSERKALLGQAAEANGIRLDYLAADEAHDALNRAGKAESVLTAVLDTTLALSAYGALMTGTPVKNDASEIGDWLRKLDPERFGDPALFQRRYGSDALAAREGLKRVADRYLYHDVVPSGTVKSIIWGAEGGDGGPSPSGHRLIGLSAQQRGALEAIDAAYQRARRARLNGEVDVEAMRTLAPNTFEGVPAGEHARVARQLMGSLGTLRHAAHARVVNDAPLGHNAKLQHVVELAAARRGKGGVVFAHSRESVRQLQRALEEAGHRVITLTGSDSAQEKARARQRFNAGEADIIICSDAGATGANLQERGEWLVNYDLPLTYKTLEQRNARIDRLGQRREIELHHLMTDSEHDRDNYRRLERKRSFGELFQGESEIMDDTGVAKYLHLARQSRPFADPMQAALF